MPASQSARCYQLFLDAVDLPLEEQQAMLARECGVDTELRNAVESLLAADRYNATSEHWLEPELSAHPMGPGPGGEIGPYRILRSLGSGGMGAVYLAQRADGQDNQQVAIKLINAGLFSSELQARFLRERQVLATLDHPAIARLLDAGISAQQPYLVIEYVEGTPIDVFSNERRLTVRERLKLFLGVCAAVQEAHRKLVIHRDIKPANILVTDAGQPKLLDFGIAKMMEPDAPEIKDHGRTALLFTPNYASPEQVRGEAMGVGADIYSLGVLLYELLTGELPLATAKAPLLEAVRLVEQEDPRPPSEVAAGPARRAELRGDLDAILLHALEKQASQRYASVESFSADIQRYLDGFPVQARGNAFRYRAAKYLRRRRAAVATAAVLALLAIGSVGAIVRSATVAHQQRGLAERRFNDLRDLASSYMYELDADLEAIPGTTKVRARMYKRSMTYLDRLGAEASSDPMLQRDVANGYSRLATVLGTPVYANLGDRKGARQSIEKALILRHAILTKKPDSVEDRLMLAYSLFLDGSLLLDAGDPAAAAAVNRESLNEADWVLSKSPSPTGRQLNVALTAALNLAVTLGGSGMAPQLGDPVAAWPYLVRASDFAVREGEVRAKVAGGAANNIYRYSNQALVELTMARLCWFGLEQQENARKHLQRAMDLLHTPGVDLENAEIRRKLSTVSQDFAMWLLEQGDFTAARPYIEYALANTREVAAKDPENRATKLDFAISEVVMGKTEALAGKADGLELMDQGVKKFREVVEADKLGAVNNSLLAGCLGLAGETALACGRIPAAIGYYSESARQAGINAANYVSDARARLDLSRAEQGLARCYERAKQPEPARLHRKAAATAAQWILDRHPDSPLAQRLLREAQSQL